MGSRKLVICDPEKGYADALATYLIGRKEFAFQVQVCSVIQEVQTILEHSGADDILISADYGLEEREELKTGRRFVLASTGQEPIGEGEIPVYKYQSGEAVLTEMIQKLDDTESLGEMFFKSIQKEAGQIIGVFSPIHRIGKTAYALELAQRLTGKSEVLYINMELYGGVGGHFPEHPAQTLADVLYYSRQESKNLYILLPTMVSQMNGFDYIAPMMMSEDMKAVTGKEWVSLIRQIMEKSIYETVILDMDEGLQGIYDILRLCTQIHMPTAKDAPEMSAKMRQFEQELDVLGYRDVWQKIVKKEQKL